MAYELDIRLLEKAADVTAMALRGAMGGEGSQAPGYAGDLFREVWGALKQAAEELPERKATGF